MAMERISYQADRAGKVIKSVRDFVRCRDKSREVVQPGELVDAVMPLVQLQAHKLRVKVQVELQPDLPCVLCDPTPWWSRCCSTWHATACRPWTCLSFVSVY